MLSLTFTRTALESHMRGCSGARQVKKLQTTSMLMGVSSKMKTLVSGRARRYRHRHAPTNSTLNLGSCSRQLRVIMTVQALNGGLLQNGSFCFMECSYNIPVTSDGRAAVTGPTYGS